MSVMRNEFESPHQFREFHRIEPAGNAQQYYRKTGNIEFSNSGPDNIIGQLVDFVFEFALNINSRRVDFRTPHETDNNIASAL